MASSPPLTDYEICHKYTITTDHPNFAMAKMLAHRRNDRSISEPPDCHCVHCVKPFHANYAYLLSVGTLDCPHCKRVIYIEHIDRPGDKDSGDNPTVTFNTDSTETIA